MLRTIWLLWMHEKLGRDGQADTFYWIKSINQSLETASACRHSNRSTDGEINSEPEPLVQNSQRCKNLDFIAVKGFKIQVKGLKLSPEMITKWTNSR